MDDGQLVDAVGNARVVRSEPGDPDGQRLIRQRDRLREAALIAIERRERIEIRRECRVIGSERSTPDRKRPFEKRSSRL